MKTDIKSAFDHFEAAADFSDVEAVAGQFRAAVARRYAHARSYEEVIADLKAQGFECGETVTRAGGDSALYCIRERPRSEFKNRWTILIPNPTHGDTPTIIAIYRIQTP